MCAVGASDPPSAQVGLGGDPEFVHEYVLVFLASLVGFFWQALIVASLTAFIDHMGKSGKQYRENVDRLRQYAKRQKLPQELRERLFLYYQVRYPDGRYFDDRSVIDDLSRPLQLEIKEHHCANVLAQLGVRTGSRLSHYLADNLAYRTFVSGARVIQAGFPPRSMFFILSGMAEVVVESDDGGTTVLTTLSDGQIFGELSLLRKEEAMTSVVVVDLLEAFELLSEAFDTICEMEPAFRQQMADGVLAHADKGAEDAAVSKGRLMWRAMEMSVKEKVSGLQSRLACCAGGCYCTAAAAAAVAAAALPAVVAVAACPTHA